MVIDKSMNTPETNKKCPCDDGAAIVKQHLVGCKYYSEPSTSDTITKIREEWHVRTINMAQEVKDYSKVETLIADWWLAKLESHAASVQGECFKNVGQLRQWLNEKAENRLVTNEDIIFWLNTKE